MSKWCRKLVGVDRLQRAGKRGQLDQGNEVGGVAHECREGHGHTGRGGELVGALLVQHRQQDVVVGFDRPQVVPLELGPVSRDELQPGVRAGEHDGPAGRCGEPLEPAAWMSPPNFTNSAQKRELRTGSGPAPSA